jgi:hypothetical protein
MRLVLLLAILLTAPLTACSQPTMIDGMRIGPERLCNPYCAEIAKAVTNKFGGQMKTFSLHDEDTDELRKYGGLLQPVGIAVARLNDGQARAVRVLCGTVADTRPTCEALAAEATP